MIGSCRSGDATLYNRNGTTTKTPVTHHKSKSQRTAKSQTLKVMAVFILAVLALMALQVASTRVHQMRWQLLDRSK
jgi:hypothetical protein